MGSISYIVNGIRSDMPQSGSRVSAGPVVEVLGEHRSEA